MLLFDPRSRLLVIALQTNICISPLGENDRISLIKELREENLPRNAFYGDGQPD